MESCYIPEDVITQILTRLPAKSLIRFKCVNKSWRDLINSYDFATRHFYLNNRSKPNLYICMSRVKMALFTRGGKRLRPDLYRSFMEDKTNCASIGDVFLIGSSSNGLVCLWRRSAKITIWNPATGDFRSIKRQMHYIMGDEITGFDARPCGDYRLVVIVIIGTNSFAELRYSKSSNCWKTISNVVGRKYMEFADLPASAPQVVCLDGCMYWRVLGNYNVEGTMRYQDVACFDMWEDKYRYITGPPWTGDSGRLGVVNGSLLGFFFSGQVRGTLDGWVMNAHDGSWTKQYSVVPFRPRDYAKHTMEELVRRRENKGMNEEEVDTIMLDEHLHYYHRPTKNITSETYSAYRHLGVVQYKETLFSV